MTYNVFGGTLSLTQSINLITVPAHNVLQVSVTMQSRVELAAGGGSTC